MQPVVVALDAMGGDFAPAATVEGAFAAVQEPGVSVLLVGDRDAIEVEANRLGKLPPGITMLQAPDAIGMDETIGLDVRNRRASSMYQGIEAVRNGTAQAFVSAGNTGAVLAIATVVLRRMSGVSRPALSAVLPLPGGPMMLLDAGANTECRPLFFVQWAHLGAAYMHVAYGIPNPRVGLLNVGEEPLKGTPLAIEAHTLLAQSGLNFVGNVEGRGMGLCDVLITDGFTGNVVLKTLEGNIRMMFGQVREAAASSLRGRIGGLLLRPTLLRLRNRFDYRQHGAVPLLGLNGLVFVGHGSSDATAVLSAVQAASEAVRRDTLETLRHEMVEVLR